MNFPRLPLSSFSHTQAGTLTRTHREQLGTAQAAGEPCSVYLFSRTNPKYVQCVHSPIESKPLCQAVLLLCLVISRRFSLKGKTLLMEILFFWFLKNL